MGLRLFKNSLGGLPRGLPPGRLWSSHFCGYIFPVTLQKSWALNRLSHLPTCTADRIFGRHG